MIEQSSHTSVRAYTTYATTKVIFQNILHENNLERMIGNLEKYKPIKHCKKFIWPIYIEERRHWAIATVFTKESRITFYDSQTGNEAVKILETTIFNQIKLFYEKYFSIIGQIYFL